jgi:hypothetical protein
MKSKKRLLLLVLFLASGLIYFGVFFGIIPDFMASRRDALERDRAFISSLNLPPAVKEALLEMDRESFSHYSPFNTTLLGGAMVLLGFVLGVMWIVGFSFLSLHMEHGNLKLLAVIMLTCGGLCFFLVGIVANHYDPAIYGSDFPYPYRDYRYPLGYLGFILLGVCLVALKQVRNAQEPAAAPERRTEPHRRRFLLPLV